MTGRDPHPAEPQESEVERGLTRPLDEVLAEIDAEEVAAVLPPEAREGLAEQLLAWADQCHRASAVAYTAAAQDAYLQDEALLRATAAVLATAEAELAEAKDALKEVGNAYGCFAGCTGALRGAPADGSGHTPSCRRARAVLASSTEPPQSLRAPGKTPGAPDGKAGA